MIGSNCSSFLRRRLDLLRLGTIGEAADLNLVVLHRRARLRVSPGTPGTPCRSAAGRPRWRRRGPRARRPAPPTHPAVRPTKRSPARQPACRCGTGGVDRSGSAAPARLRRLRSLRGGRGRRSRGFNSSATGFDRFEARPNTSAAPRCRAGGSTAGRRRVRRWRRRCRLGGGAAATRRRSPYRLSRRGRRARRTRRCTTETTVGRHEEKHELLSAQLNLVKAVVGRVV